VGHVKNGEERVAGGRLTTIDGVGRFQLSQLAVSGVVTRVKLASGGGQGIAGEAEPVYDWKMKSGQWRGLVPADIGYRHLLWPLSSQRP